MKTAIAIPIVIVIFIFGNLLTGHNTVIDNVQKTFDNVSELHVEGSFANVVVSGESRNSIDFSGELSAYKERDDVSIEYEVRGDALYVWIERPNSLSRVSGNLTFLVPQNTAVFVNNSSGSVKASGITAEAIRLKASSGSIAATDIEGDMTVSASSGSLKIANIVGKVLGSTSSGSITVNKVKGDLKLNSSSGGQSITMVKGAVVTNASSGSLKFSNIKGDIKAKTSSGSIRLSEVKGSINLISSSGSQNGENIVLTEDSSFKSSSGSIKMNLANSADELRFKLYASSGSLHAKGETGRKNLELGSGSILIKGSSNSGSQKYY